MTFTYELYSRFRFILKEEEEEDLSKLTSWKILYLTKFILVFTYQ